VKSCSKNTVFGYEEDLFLLRVECTVDNCVSEGFDVILLFGLYETLVNDLLLHFHRMDHTASN